MFLNGSEPKFSVPHSSWSLCLDIVLPRDCELELGIPPMLPCHGSHSSAPGAVGSCPAAGLLGVAWHSTFSHSGHWFQGCFSGNREYVEHSAGQRGNNCLCFSLPTLRSLVGPLVSLMKTPPSLTSGSSAQTVPALHSSSASSAAAAEHREARIPR